MVVKKDGVVNSHRPEGKIRLFGPVNGEVYEHGSGGGLNVLNGLFNDTISVVLADSSKLLGLTELFQVFLVVMAVEDSCIVAAIALWNHAQIPTISLKFLLGAKCFVGVQRFLMVSHDAPGCIVDKEC